MVRFALAVLFLSSAIAGCSSTSGDELLQIEKLRQQVSDLEQEREKVATQRKTAVDFIADQKQQLQSIGSTPNRDSFRELNASVAEFDKLISMIDSKIEDARSQLRTATN